MLAVCGGVLFWASRSAGSHGSSHGSNHGSNQSQREENDNEAAEYLAEAQDILESDGPLAAADYLIEGIEQGYDREALLAMREDIIAHTVITRETVVGNAYNGVFSSEVAQELTWEYDSMGNMICDESGNTYEYDSEGNLIHKTIRIDSGEWLFSWEWNKVLMTDIDGSGEYTYEYDSEGNVVRITGIKGGDSEEYKKYEYDNDGNVVHITGIGSDGDSAEGTFEYDNDGNMVCSTVTGDEGDYVEECEYDSLGNGLRYRQTIIADGEGYEEFTYTYEYAYYANKKIEQQ